MISVIVPHLNEPARLERCLAALDSQRADGIAFEVVVADNGSWELPQAICDRFEGVRLVCERVPGPGPARNNGAAAAQGEILAFIDADCVVDGGWITAIARAFATSDVDVIGGDIRILPRQQRRTALEAYEDVYSYRARLFVERHGYAATGNMAVRAGVFRAVGPFQGPKTYEDVAWGRAARAKGYRIAYVPEARVLTDGCGTFQALTKRLDRLVVHSRSDLSHLGRTAWGVRTALVLLSPLLEIGYILTTHRLAGARERWGVLSILTKTRVHRARRMAALWFGWDGQELIATWNRD